MDIVDLIDSAVSDWQTSDDAMRYSPASKAAPIVSSGATMLIGDGPAIPLLSFELVTRPFVEQANAAAEAFRLMGPLMAEITVGLSASLGQLARALGLVPHHTGPGAPPCACHPAPFPAARDYRRRTKHRNRRRRP